MQPSNQAERRWPQIGEYDDHVANLHPKQLLKDSKLWSMQVEMKPGTRSPKVRCGSFGGVYSKLLRMLVDDEPAAPPAAADPGPEKLPEPPAAIPDARANGARPRFREFADFIAWYRRPEGKPHLRNDDCTLIVCLPLGTPHGHRRRAQSVLLEHRNPAANLPIHRRETSAGSSLQE